MPSDAPFVVRGLEKRYGGRTVLSVPELAIPRGQITGIVGPSGAGKSTLLCLLNMLETPSSGSITFCGHTTNGGGRPPLELRRRMAMVFQRPILLSTSVRHNVTYGLKLRGTRNCEQVVQGVLRDLGLEPLAKAYASTLSGGEAQRVALARALVLRPKALLLDEPTANLDPYNVSLIEAMIAKCRAEGTTVVLVTHNIFQARRLADYVVFLLSGQMVEAGPAPQIFDAPRDARTAAFVRGDMVY